MLALNETCRIMTTLHESGRRSFHVQQKAEVTSKYDESHVAVEMGLFGFAVCVLFVASMGFVTASRRKL